MPSKALMIFTGSVTAVLCPPPGKPHRYFFKLYALDKMLDLKPGATKKDVESAMKGHILAEGQLMGTYQRR